tara:strand:+ start:184 stop:681 length:498 start_codon:yes stop_codon:yes gene_type:complete
MSEDFHIDLSTVEDTGGSFEPIPEGTYELMAEDWEQKISKAGNKYLKVTYRVQGENYANRVIWENFTISGANPTVGISRLKQWMIATGSNATELNRDAVNNLMMENFMAKIGIEKNDQYGDSNKIISFLRPKMTEAMPVKKEPVVETTTQQVSTATGNAIGNWDE